MFSVLGLAVPLLRLQSGPACLPACLPASIPVPSNHNRYNSKSLTPAISILTVPQSAGERDPFVMMLEEPIHSRTSNKNSHEPLTWTAVSRRSKIEEHPSKNPITYLADEAVSPSSTHNNIISHKPNTIPGNK